MNTDKCIIVQLPLTFDEESKAFIKGRRNRIEIHKVFIIQR